MKLRDVRVTSVYAPEGKAHVNVSVEAVIESQGTGEADCEAGLLVQGIEYGSNAAAWGAMRRTLDDGWWTFGRYVPRGKLRVASGRQGVVEFHFGVLTSSLQRNGQFRLDCERLVTPWVHVEIPELNK